MNGFYLLYCLVFEFFFPYNIKHYSENEFVYDRRRLRAGDWSKYHHKNGYEYAVKKYIIS